MVLITIKCEQWYSHTSKTVFFVWTRNFDRQAGQNTRIPPWHRRLVYGVSFNVHLVHAHQNHLLSVDCWLFGYKYLQWKLFILTSLQIAATVIFNYLFSAKLDGKTEKMPPKKANCICRLVHYKNVELECRMYDFCSNIKR